MKDKIKRELDDILQIIKRKDNGVKIADIIAELETPLARRTVLRRLNELLNSGGIQAEGDKNARKYFVESKRFAIPLSDTSGELKSHVKRPLEEREPVSYKHEFLRSYLANETFYLTETERQHLKKIGKQCVHQQEPGTYIKRFLHRLLLELSWNSSRLEGNTYSLLETKRLFDLGIEAEGKAAQETQMILNHKEAIEFIVDNISRAVSKYILLNTHALLSNNLLSNSKSCGQIRNIPVGIDGTVYTPLEIPQSIEENFQLIIDTADQIKDPFEQSFFFMVHIPYLQAFEDVNKRVSRLVANIPLIKSNLSPLSFTDVPKDDYISGLIAVYELNKIDLLKEVFIWAYERSAIQYKAVRESIGKPDLFRLKYQNEIRDIINLIINNHYHGRDIVNQIEFWSKQHIAKEHQSLFSQMVENEISSLHIGNIAVYRIDLDKFEDWVKAK